MYAWSQRFEVVKEFIYLFRVKAKILGRFEYKKRKYKSERQRDIKKNWQLFDLNTQYECESAGKYVVCKKWFGYRGRYSGLNYGVLKGDGKLLMELREDFVRKP